jgi:hypothetical protein
MATIRELIVKFGFEVDETPLKKMEQGIETLKSSFIALTGVAVTAAGAVFGIAKSTANAAEEIKDASIAAGISYEMLQKLSYAAAVSGVSNEDLAVSLKQLSRAAYDAKDGTSETAKVFQKLGVSALNASGDLKSPDELLLQLSDTFKKMPAGMEKSALALQLFGRGGNKMIQFLNEGSAAINELGASASDLGIIMNDVAIEAGDNFNDTLHSLLATLQGIIRIIGSGIIPVINDMMVDMRGWIKANRELIKTRLQSFVQILIKYLQQLWRVVTAVYYVIKGMITGIDKISASIGGFITVLKVLGSLIGLYFLGRMGMALFDVAKGFLAIGKAAIMAWRSAFLGPILIGAAVLGAFLIIEDFIAWLDGRPSTLGFLLKNKDKIIAAIYNFYDKIRTKIANFLGVSGGAFDEWAIRIIATLAGVTAFFIGKTVIGWIAGFAKMGMAVGTFALKIATGFGSMALSAGQSIAMLISNIARFTFVLVAMAAQSAASWAIAFWPVTLAIAAVAALGTAVYFIIKYWQDISSTLSNVWNAFLTGANNLLNWFNATVKNVFDTIVSMASSTYDGVVGIWGSLVTWFGGLWQSIIDVAVISGNKIKSAIIDPIKNAFNSIAGALGFATDTNINQVQSVIASPFAGVTPATTTGNTTNANATTNQIQSTINVTVPPGSDATGIGEAVRQAANEEFAKILRPAARATRPAVAY